MKKRILSPGHTSNIFIWAFLWFLALGAYLIKKYACHTQAFFLCFSPFRDTVRWISSRSLQAYERFWYFVFFFCQYIISKFALKIQKINIKHILSFIHSIHLVKFSLIRQPLLCLFTLDRRPPLRPSNGLGEPWPLACSMLCEWAKVSCRAIHAKEDRASHTFFNEGLKMILKAFEKPSKLGLGI